MTLAQFNYLFPYFVSLLLSTAVLVSAWKRRQARSALAFSGYALGQTLWIAGFIFEVLSPELAYKIFWDGFQLLASLLILITIPVFAVQYIEYKLKRPTLLFLSSLVIPAVMVPLLITDNFHHLIYHNPRLLAEYPFSELIHEYTWLIYGYAAYLYSITLWTIFILAQRIFRSHGLYRVQLILIALGIFISIFGSIFVLFDVHVIPQRDATPFFAALGNLLISWGLSRFKIFEIVPIARDQVFEAMVDPVVILDNQNNIVDINSSMLALMGKNADEVIGQQAKSIFQDFPIPIKLYTHVSYARTEASFQLGGKEIYYELTVWPLYNSRKEMTGRIYISHDITALKELENELRKLNAELEDRVRARTWELAEAYDTTLEGWARALELRDKETEGHSRRVTDTTLRIAHELALSEDDMEHIRRGAILHDIGKMSIPDEILHKPGKLTPEERAIINQHPETAYKLLSPIPFLQKALEIPYSHHEKWDGSGYPRGLKGEEIPLAARIFAISDVWDALTSNRSYNDAWPREKAMTYFVEQSGKHFDPHLVNVFLKLVEKGEI